MKPNLPPLDLLSKRLGLAAIGSVLVNGGLFYAMSLGASQIAKSPDYHDVEVRRIEIDQSGQRIEKLVKPKEIEQKIKRLVEQKKVAAPKPEPEKRTSRPAPTTKPAESSRPEGAHNRILTKPKAEGESPKPSDFGAQSGGNAELGKPTTGQNTGDAKVNPPEPPRQDPPKQDPPKQDPPKQDPPKQDPPKTEPPPADPPKLPVTPPPAKGPSKEAEPVKQILPEIPDSLKTQDFKSFVRVVVDIDVDGSIAVTLRTSSGNDEVDRRVLEALKKWKWKPALKDGEPVKSTQRFKFNFEVG